MKSEGRESRGDEVEEVGFGWVAFVPVVRYFFRTQETENISSPTRLNISDVGFPNDLGVFSKKGEQTALVR